MEDKLQQLLDEREIIHVVNSIGINADLRNWQAVLQAFTDEVLLDYSSMGVPVETVHAIHHLPNESDHNTWLVVGQYEHHLIRLKQVWRVNKMKLIATLIDGNMDLPQMARRASAGNAGSITQRSQSN